jgi:ATP-dependent exoDNAse (exonuclease V) beta subunit
MRVEGEGATLEPSAPVWVEHIRPEGGFPRAWHDHTLVLVRVLIRRYMEDQSDVVLVADLVEHIRASFQEDKGELYKLLQIDSEEKQNSISPVENDASAEAVPSSGTASARGAEDSLRQTSAPTLVLSTLHKVKGVEYDAVIIPPSFQSLPFPNPKEDLPEAKLQEIMEEERRLLYVGMTRARDRLVRYEWKREKNLARGVPFDLKGEYALRVGCAFDTNAYSGRVMISKCASERPIRRDFGFQSVEEYFEYVEQEVSHADAVHLERDRSRWFLVHGKHRIAQLSNGASRNVEQYLKDHPRLTHEKARDTDTLRGLAVSSVSRYTYQDSVDYDADNNTNYTRWWHSFFQEKGFTYVVNFAGYAKTD